MKPTAAVIGAGVLGRLLALRLQRSGWEVTLYDRSSWDDRSTCSFAAAGLLTPAIECIDGGNETLLRLGLESRGLWAEILSTLPSPVVLGQRGTFHVAHAQDIGLLYELKEKISRRLPFAAGEIIGYEQISQIEPSWSKSGFKVALHLQTDGYIQSHEALNALKLALSKEHVNCRLETAVTSVSPSAVTLGSGETYEYSMVFDCRGLSANPDLTELRGVRGELIEVYAPEVALELPIHVLHQRYPIYVVPRGRQVYAIGATSIESESMAPVTIKAALELLSAAYSLHSGFRYAHIVGMVANCRPAFADNMPRIIAQDGLWRLNGLYRHGFLLAPVLVDCVLKRLNGHELSEHRETLFSDAGKTQPLARGMQWN